MTICLVGMLMGDAWMTLPAVLQLRGPVSLIVGSYSLPVWRWAKNHIRDVNFDITEIIDDPDDADHPFCPGKGFYAITAALAYVREKIPGALGVEDVGSFYLKVPPRFETTFDVFDGEHIVLHPRTSHVWKNLDDVFKAFRFTRPIKIVGFPGEWPLTSGQTFVEGFDNQVREVLQARCVIGVLSSFTNLASLFGKQQLVVSFTSDASMAMNPRARVLVNPTREEALRVVAEWNL